MRLLGLDLGSRRIGVAVSDELGIAAHAFRTLVRRGDQRDVETIAAIVQETGALEVVLGYPLDGDGSEGAAARRASRFAERLRVRLGLPVHLQDERFSTVEAEEVLLCAGLSRQKRRHVIDRLAAANILTRFMDSLPTSR